MNVVTYKPNHFIDRFFDDDPFFNNAFRWNPEWAPAKTSSVKVNVVENEDNFTLTAQVPGLTEKDISVETRDGKLFLKGHVEEKTEKQEENYHMREFASQSFERSFVLGDGVDPEKISAKLDSGVLTLVLPKREEVKPKTVKVEIQGTS